MKEYLLSLLSNTPNPLQARNQAREYLQALILQSLQRAVQWSRWPFTAGRRCASCTTANGIPKTWILPWKGMPRHTIFALISRASATTWKPRGTR